ARRGADERIRPLTPAAGLGTRRPRLDPNHTSTRETLRHFSLLTPLPRAERAFCATGTRRGPETSPFRHGPSRNGPLPDSVSVRRQPPAWLGVLLPVPDVRGRPPASTAAGLLPRPDHALPTALSDRPGRE